VRWHEPADREAPVDAGLGLPELLVAMTLLGILTTIIATTSILGIRTSHDLQNRLEDSSQGEIGILSVSKVLRTAVLPDQLDDQACANCADTAIVRAGATQLSFYANLDNTGQGPSLVTISVIEDPHHRGTAILQEKTQPPIPGTTEGYHFCDPAVAGCAVRTRTVSRGLVWPASRSFTYYDFAGAPLDGTQLALDQLARVSSIDVTIPVRGAPDTSTTTAVQRVRLPNADINLLVPTT
jgi:prepilin-type N-terminal cleavage/methylation domain-containing protein